MKKIVCFLLIVVMSAFAVVAFGCNKDDVVRVNEVTHSIFYAPQYLAMALGYFEEEGIKIELTNGGGADNVMTALLTNEADIGLLGCEATIYVYLQGKTDYPKIVAQLTNKDGSFLIGRNPASNFDYSNLAGSTVLMGRKGGMPAMILQYVLNNHGYYDGVNITMDYSVQFNMLAPAFSGGTGDYVGLFEPTASQMVKEGKGYIVSALGADSGEIPYTCYSASSKFAQKNPEKLQKFVDAVWKGVEYVYNNDTKDVATLLLPYFEGTELDLIESALDNYKKYNVWMQNPTVDREAFERIQDIMQNAGELSKRVEYDKIVAVGK